MKSFFLLLLGLLIGLFAQAQWQKPGEIRQEIGVHDPVMIQQDSVFYLFCTGRGIGRYRSPDLLNWERLEGVFPEAPAWVMERMPDFRNHIWAPDIAYHNGRYLLFYSVSRFAQNTSCIGMVSTPTLHPEDPDYAWTDHGPVICSEPGEDDWNAIDPNLILDEAGQPWLSFGSFWGGLQLFAMNDSLTGPAEGAEVQLIAARARSAPENLLEPGDGAIEAPFMIERDGWYYLFVSFDYCCRGEKSSYHIRVGRAREVTGPFVDREGKSLLEGGGSLLMQGSGRWAAVGHNAVENVDGKDFLLCHGYDREDEGRPKLIIQPLSWSEDKWPVVEHDGEKSPRP